jgi:hypothetical protein
MKAIHAHVFSKIHNKSFFAQRLLKMSLELPASKENNFKRVLFFFKVMHPDYIYLFRKIDGLKIQKTPNR